MDLGHAWLGVLILSLSNLCASNASSICVEYFEKAVSETIYDDGTINVNHIITDFTELGNSSLDNVNISMSCISPYSETFKLENKTMVILRQSISKLNCEQNVIVPTCNIYCYEPGQSRFPQTLRVQIERTDYADPRFLQSTYIVNVSEFARPGTPLKQMANEVIDEDCLDHGRGFNFGLETTGNGTFTMTASGEFLLEKMVDYESSNEDYILNASVTHSSKNAYTTIVVHVIDEDDMDPTFNTTLYSLTVQESNGSSVNKTWLPTTPPIYAYDRDLGAGRQNLTYSIENGYNTFEINASSGLIRLKTSVDRETNQSYSLIIKVEQENDRHRSATASLSVTVADINDNTPKFHPKVYNETIWEHTAVGEEVVMVSATDSDEGENAVVLYELLDNEYFSINNQSGLITVKSSQKLDRESIRTITLQATAVDMKSNVRGDNASVIVTLLDINDNPPKFSMSNYSFHLSNRSIVGQVSATDADLLENANITYILQDLPDRKYFKIDKQGGVLSRAAVELPPNRDSFILVVVARDHGYPPLESTVTVKISQQLVIGNMVRLGTPLSLQSLKQNSAQLERDIGKILKMIVRTSKTESNHHSSGSFLYITAQYLNKTEVQGNDLQRNIIQHMSEIQTLFYTDPHVVDAVKSHSMTSAEIALIVIAGVILIGSIIAIAILFRKYETLKRYTQLNDHLRRRSSLYESQEIKVKLEDKTSDYDGSLNTQEIEEVNAETEGKVEGGTAFSNPVYTNDEQTTVKMISTATDENDKNTASVSKEIDAAFSSLDDRLNKEELNSPPTTYENTNILNTENDQMTSPEADLVNVENGEHVYFNTQFNEPGALEGEDTQSNIQDEKSENSKDPDKDHPEPEPDYNKKEVRFSTQVLDTDANKFEPLRTDDVHTVSSDVMDREDDATEEPSDIDDDRVVHLGDKTEEVEPSDVEDDRVVNFGDESDRMDEEIISPVDFLKPENKDDNGEVLGTFHFGVGNTESTQF